MLRPGQSWCVVSSPDERDTHIQVIVPGISNWDKRMKTAVVRWVDATWVLPARAVARSTVGHELVTRIERVTDRKPLTKYRVRYKILDAPPAIFLPSQTQEEVVISDLNGLAKVRLQLVRPGTGVNRISVEIIRPPDPTAPSGSGVSIVTGETAVEWLAPGVELRPPVPGRDGILMPPPGGVGAPTPLPDGKLGPPAPPPGLKLGPPSSLGVPMPN